MIAIELKRGIIVRGPVFPEPIEVLVVTPLGDVIKIVGAGQKTGQVHQRVLRLDQLQFLDATPEREPFDGDPARFRLGVEAARLARHERVAGYRIVEYQSAGEICSRPSDGPRQSRLRVNRRKPRSE